MNDREYALHALRRITHVIFMMLMVIVGLAVVAVSRANPIGDMKIEITMPHVFALGNWMESAIDWLNGKLVGDKIVLVVLAFVPGLLGIAYPLFVQTISRLNDHYGSTHIVNKFKSERKHKWFSRSLIISVVVTFASIGQNTWVILLDFLLTVNLLAAFFYYIELLLTYQSPSDLFKLYLSRIRFERLDKRVTVDMTRRVKDQLLDSWPAMIDIYKYAIARDRKLMEDVHAFISRSFSFIKYIEQKSNEIILFPTEFYNSSVDIIVTFLRNRDDFYHQNVEFFVGPIFFCDGEPERQVIHPNTYAAIWRNLYSLVEHDRDEKVIGYWKSAHQHCRFNLSPPTPEYDKNQFEETQRSSKLRKKISDQRNSFLEFHTALGAYLMHKRKFRTLYEVWIFTQSQPPEYVLIPQNTTLIFQLYFKFLNSSMFNPQFPIAFYFKDLEFDAMNNRPDVKSVTSKYCIILLLKLWTTPNYFGQSSVTMPTIPSSNADKKQWEEDMQYFKRDLQRILDDEELLKDLKLDQITRYKCLMRNLPYPIDFIDNLLKALKDGFQETLNNAPLDDELTKKLDDYTVDTVKDIYKKFRRISGADVQKENRDSVSDSMQVIRGSKTILEKEAFIKNASTSHLDYHKVMGRAIRNEYYNHVAIKFSTNVASNNRYEVAGGQLFQAVDRLKLNPNDHVIVSFNLNLAFGKIYEGVKIDAGTSGEDYRYKGVPIYTFDVGNPIVDKTLFILQKANLPMIRHRDWSEILDLPEDVEKYWSDFGAAIDADLNIYRKFTELGKDASLLAEYEKNGSYNKEQLKNMVEVNIDFLGYCWFRRGTKIVAIKEGRIFQEGGVDALASIKEF